MRLKLLFSKLFLISVGDGFTPAVSIKHKGRGDNAGLPGGPGDSQLRDSLDPQTPTHSIGRIIEPRPSCRGVLMETPLSDNSPTPVCCSRINQANMSNYNSPTFVSPTPVAVMSPNQNIAVNEGRKEAKLYLKVPVYILELHR